MQENVEVVQDQRVVHRAIMSYFTEYSSELGRCVLCSPAKRVVFSAVKLA